MNTKKDASLTNEAVLIQSVICSKKVKLIAHTKTTLKRIKSGNSQFIPEVSSIQINATLLKDLIVIQGFIKGSIIVDGKLVKNTTLPFQEEIFCDGICPGDVLKHTSPSLEGVLPPQFIPHEGHEGCNIVFKVILSIQATVVREKLGTINVTIIGDINENRCKSPFNPSLIVSCDGEKETCEDDFYSEQEIDTDFPCLNEDCKD
ncbi:hypothetical protein [Alkalihalobacillus deserti]|uniref:hypothetical protein n=1 Tax=Alkalihalobacillus deserti TaxID=2879466 RepID=UPI001D1338DA|nr:hypothetical protein [Alkalihalobacillus deserti]